MISEWCDTHPRCIARRLDEMRDELVLSDEECKRLCLYVEKKHPYFEKYSFNLSTKKFEWIS